jgi:hypothetical protein
MAHQILHQPIDVSESKKSFEKRKGELMPNHGYGRYASNGDTYKPVTTDSARHQPKYRETHTSRLLNGTPVGVGRVTRVGRNIIRPDDTEQYVQGLIDNLQDHELIVERYPTHYCHGTSSRGNGNTCFFDTFVRDYQKSEEVCGACGITTKLVTYLYTNSMNDEGKVDQDAANHGGADATLGSNTTGPPQGDVPIPSHRSRYGRIKSMIRNFEKISHIVVMEKIIKRASNILQQLYEKKHPSTSYQRDDNQSKMPQGEAATAAACFYAALTEHEQLTRDETPITVADIVNCANQEITKEVVRSVTDKRVLTICVNVLIKDNCIRPNIKNALENGLHRNSNVRRARLEVLRTCGYPVKVRLTKNLSAGFAVETETNSGILKVESVSNSGHAYHQGLRQGDYIIGFQEKDIPEDETVDMFQERFLSSKAASGSQHTLTVRRLAKNPTKSTGMPKLGVRRRTNKRKQNSAEASNSAKRRRTGP